MRAIGLGSVILVMVTLLVTEAAHAASNAWCATYSWKGINDNCSFATQQQCLAQVWGLGGFCRPNPFPGSAYGTGYTWSSRPPRQTRGGY
jgi:Protein of unknown function (DUF3551)